LLLYSSHLALGVSNWPVIYFINYMPTSSLALYISAPSAGDSSDDGEGDSSADGEAGGQITKSGEVYIYIN
jgi:hypothetical protein